MLKIEDLWVSIDEKEILKGIDLHIPQGETHVLFGKNGSGKSTLLMTIMGFQRYRVKQGKIYLQGQHDHGHLRPLDSWGREEGPDQNSARFSGLSRPDSISSHRGLSVPGVPGGIIMGRELIPIIPGTERCRQPKQKA